MEKVVLVNRTLAAQRAGDLAVGLRPACARGTQDAAPPGLRTNESALIGSKMQVSQLLCSRELSPKSYGCLAPEGRHLECRGRKPTAPHQLARRAASAQISNTTCSIEPPQNPCHRRLHQLRLYKSYPHWLTIYSPPRRPRSVDRGLAPTAFKMPPLRAKQPT